jgi:hypothetical protein
MFFCYQKKSLRPLDGIDGYEDLVYLIGSGRAVKILVKSIARRALIFKISSRSSIPCTFY